MKVLTSMMMLIISLQSYCQNFSLNELINLTSYSPSKFTSYVSKRGYQPEQKESNFIKYRFKGNESQKADSNKVIIKYYEQKGSSISFERLTPVEYTQLKQLLNNQGFSSGILKSKQYTEVFQKNNLTLFTTAEIDLDENARYYNIMVEENTLPKAKEINYAEDLLQLDSHEQLLYVYGKANTSKDVFIDADGSAKNCSVLFPNTDRQAVFLWKDEANYRDIASIRIGGNIQTKNTIGFNRSINQNAWTSSQGIYQGMTLQELQQRNNDEIEFIGDNWNRGAMTANESSGKIDFKKISLVLGCLNCNEASYRKGKKITSTKALEEDKRIYVSGMILYQPSNEK